MAKNDCIKTVGLAAATSLYSPKPYIYRITLRQNVAFYQPNATEEQGGW